MVTRNPEDRTAHSQIAKGCELVDVAALFSFRVGPDWRSSRFRVDEVNIGIGQQVPDDGQQGKIYRDDRAFLVTASGDASIAFARGRRRPCP